MSLRSAIDTLAQITFSGLRRSYDTEGLRGVGTPDLPALLPIPNASDAIDRIGYGAVSTSFDEGHIIRHRLLISTFENTVQGEAVADTVCFIDRYLEAVQEMPKTTGAWWMHVRRYEPGIVDWYGVPYYGIDFFVEIGVCD